MSVKTYKDKGYARVEVVDSSVKDVINSVLGFNEGDLQEGLVFDGKVVPTVNLRPLSPIWTYEITLVANTTYGFFNPLEITERGLFKIFLNTAWGFAGDVYVFHSIDPLGSSYIDGLLTIAGNPSLEFVCVDPNQCSISNRDLVDDVDVLIEYWGM